MWGGSVGKGTSNNLSSIHRTHTVKGKIQLLKYVLWFSHQYSCAHQHTHSTHTHTTTDHTIYAHTILHTHTPYHTTHHTHTYHTTHTIHHTYHITYTHTHTHTAHHTHTWNYLQFTDKGICYKITFYLCICQSVDIWVICPLVVMNTGGKIMHVYKYKFPIFSPSENTPRGRISRSCGRSSFKFSRKSFP